MKKHKLGWIVLALVLSAAITWAGVANKAAVFDGIVETTSGGYMFPDGTLQTTGIVVAAATKTYELIGTTAPVLSEIGVLGMTRACQAEFGADTRMCTTKEIIETVNLPQLAAYSALTAWVQPVIVDVGDDVPKIYDISGAFSANVKDLSCDGWSNISTSGNVLGMSAHFAGDGSYEGRLLPRQCAAIDTGVACCGLVSQ